MSTRRLQRGYTAVEVLSALTLLAIGGAGVIGMQKVTLQGSEDARRYDIGGNIANEWLSRLQRDSVQWTQPNATFPNNNNINLTQWLRLIPGCAAAFCNPPPIIPAEGMSGAFDTFGHDVPAGTPATYCAQFRLQWVADIGAAPPFNPAAIIRAEVRVFWSRLELNPIGDCTAATTTPDAANANQLYHFIVATTAIRENALKQ